MLNETETDSRSRWGVARFGKRNIPAMAIAIPSGLALGLAAGIVAGLAGLSDGTVALKSIVFGLVFSWSFIAFIWIAIVDRGSLRGAVGRPEESIESRWHDEASAGAFTDMIAVAGIALTVLILTGKTFDATWALIGFLCFAGIDVAARYLILKKRS